MLFETVFSTRCQPRKGIFLNNAKGKIGKQRIHNRLKFIVEIKEDWLGLEFANVANKTLLNGAFFQDTY